MPGDCAGVRDRVRRGPRCRASEAGTRSSARSSSRHRHRHPPTRTSSRFLSTPTRSRAPRSRSAASHADIQRRNACRTGSSRAVPCGVRDDERTKRALVFGEVAELYDRARPSYPDELINDVVAAIPDAGAARVLEVGAGTGKATKLLAPRLGRLVALEPDPAMAVIASRHCDPLGNVDVVVDRFEDWVTAGPRFASIVAAHCWHWVDPRVGYERRARYSTTTASLPRSGTCPCSNAASWCRDQRGLPRAAPGLEDKTSTTRTELLRLLRKPPGLRGSGDARVRLGPGVPASEYTDMLCTHSDHHLLPAAERDARSTACATSSTTRRHDHSALRDPARRPRPGLRACRGLHPPRAHLGRGESALVPRRGARLRARLDLRPPRLAQPARRAPGSARSPRSPPRRRSPSGSGSAPSWHHRTSGTRSRSRRSW